MGTRHRPSEAMTQSGVDHPSVHCAECSRSVDDFTAIAEKWRYWSDGSELVVFCPECARREFLPDPPRERVVPLVKRRDA